MLVEQRFRNNSPHVVHETIEGEVIMVNLDTGSYYSLDGAGAVLWEHLQQGASLGAAVEAVRHQYTAEAGVIEDAAQALLEALLAENLLLPRESPPAEAALGAAPDGKAPRPFVVPTLSKHTDMQDLLLLDPIHEVDQAGWPAAKA